MIQYTTEEMLIYNKVKTSYHQQDLIDWLTDLKKDKEEIQQHESCKQNIEKLNQEIQNLEKLINKIKELNTPEEFIPYERYVESAYWDPEVLQCSCELLLDAFQNERI